MGLDIRVYDKVRWIAEGDARKEEDGGYAFRIMPHWDEYNRRPVTLREGWYSCPENSAGGWPDSVYHFRAGSYGGYNMWREMLTVAIWGVTPKEAWPDPEKWRGKPFFELIFFSDCEGAITGKVCERLALDFGTREGEIREAIRRNAWSRNDSYQHWDDIFWEKYDDWKTAFEMAAPEGAVVFG